MKDILKKSFPDVLAVALFVLISMAYMLPAMSGKIISQSDHIAGAGSGREISQYQKMTGETSRWTNSVFSGMPTFQSAPDYPAYRILEKVKRAYALFLPQYVWHLFALLLGFYILMRSMRFSALLSFLGALVWALSSYFIIIIAEGHIWKVMTLAFIPPTIAGMVLVYRQKYYLGFFLTSLFSALQLMSNHLQMTYYFLFVMGAFFLAFLFEAVKGGTMKKFIRSTAVLIVAGLIGVAVNSSNLYHTYQYSKQSTRGGSELVYDDSSKQSKDGLDRKYITEWCYGIDETMTLLVPDFKGGASRRGNTLMSMSENKVAMKSANKSFMNIYKALPQYFGKQQMTCGPVYVGAIVCLLFFLGIILVGGPVKWALVVLTLLSFLLSWGRNLQWFTDFFIDYVPLYSKFRAVSSILVIAEFTFPLLGVMGLAKYLELVSVSDRRAGKALIASLAITGGLCLIVALFPSLCGETITRNEYIFLETQADQCRNAGVVFPITDIVNDLSAARHSMVSASAWRSLIFILAGFFAIYFCGRGRISRKACILIVVSLCLVDLWSVDKRYLRDDMFRKVSYKEATVQKTSADEYILKDSTLDFRVLNLASDTFNENNTSYWHHSIGGYHAAKLRRYDELMSRQIKPEIKKFSRSLDSKDLHVLNMLNARYFILPCTVSEPLPYYNEHACGNAWFADKLMWVQNANEEIDALSSIDPARTAVVDVRFESQIPYRDALPVNSNASVSLVEYYPNELVYEVCSEAGGLVIFSEIYYPGWKASIDGKPAVLSRADYVLRALPVPEGRHRVVMEFRPDSLKFTDNLSYAALALMFLSFIGEALVLIRKRKTDFNNA